MKLKSLFFAAIFLSALVAQTDVAFGQEASATPAPPALLNTSYPTPTGPTICAGPVTGITCDYQFSTGDLQGALNEASIHNEGASVVLSATATFTGKFILPYRPATVTSWIIIRTSNMEGIAPAETRINPATHAASMPKIEIAIDQPAIEAAAGAHHYRLVGLEIRLASNAVNNSNGLVKVGFGTETSATQLPSDITFDRCYIHGTGNINLKRGINLNGKSTAVIDSYISKCHGVVYESQALGGWNGPGPFKIVNNYLEGSGENLIFGGSDATIPQLVPSDIEIRRNHFYKPTSWRHVWLVKNLLELKSARRVLIDGNVLENNWDSSDVCQTISPSNCGQRGTAVLFTVRNDNGGAPWNTIEDVQFTNNRISHAVAGFMILSPDDGHVSGQMKRVAIRNNLLEDINSNTWGKSDGSSHAQLFLIVSGTTDPGPADVHITHNTGFHTGNLFANIIWAGSHPTENIAGFIFTDNITPHNSNTNQNGGVAGYGQSIGNPTLNAFFPGVTFIKNVMMGGLSSLYSQYPGNFFPANWASVGFVDMANGNYRLTESSPYKNAGTDGKDIGIDQDALERATSGAKSGIWSTNVMQDVVWTNLVGATANGNELTKTGTTTGWNAGATSVQTLSGNGYVEFSTDNATTGKACGLNSNHVGQNYTEIDYVITLGASGYIRIYENGVAIPKPDTTSDYLFGRYAAGDVFRVEISDGMVKYHWNDTEMTKHAINPASQYVVDTSLLTPGAKITNARIFAAAPNLTWTNLVGVVVNSSNGLTKTSTTTGWNAGAYSVQALSGDGYVEFSTGENSTGKTCGLSADFTGSNYVGIDYAISLGGANQARIYENGQLKGTFAGNYMPGQRYRVSIEGTVVKYYKDGVAHSYTGTVSPTHSLRVDASLSTPGATITDPVISGAWGN